VVSVTEVEPDGAEFVTKLAPTTVKEFRIAEPVTVSLNVKSMVLSADLIAVNVGRTWSAAFAFSPLRTSRLPVISPVPAT